MSTGHVGTNVGACMGEASSALLPKSMANMCLLWWYSFSLRHTHTPWANKGLATQKSEYNKLQFSGAYVLLPNAAMKLRFPTLAAWAVNDKSTSPSAT